LKILVTIQHKKSKIMLDKVLLEKVKIPCIPNQASNSAHEKAFRPYKANTAR
jgi:hypothetical protein